MTENDELHYYHNKSFVNAEPDAVVFTERRPWTRLVTEKELELLQRYVIVSTRVMPSGLLLFLKHTSDDSRPWKVARFVVDDETGKVQVHSITVDAEQLHRLERVKDWFFDENPPAGAEEEKDWSEDPRFLSLMEGGETE